VLRNTRPTRITDASPSQTEQLHHREIRYVLMMGIRAVCLVVIVVLVKIHAPLVWLWVPVLLFGMFIVPWLAVILANDRMPRRRYQMTPKPQLGQRALTSGAPPAEPHRVIDIDPDDASRENAAGR
jgi:Flp pilus assembly protein TadB